MFKQPAQDYSFYCQASVSTPPPSLAGTMTCNIHAGEEYLTLPPTDTYEIKPNQTSCTASGDILPL
jgi:hypothetical protein